MYGKFLGRKTKKNKKIEEEPVADNNTDMHILAGAKVGWIAERADGVLLMITYIRTKFDGLNPDQPGVYRFMLRTRNNLGYEYNLEGERMDDPDPDYKIVEVYDSEAHPEIAHDFSNWGMRHKKTEKESGPAEPLRKSPPTIDEDPPLSPAPYMNKEGVVHFAFMTREERNHYIMDHVIVSEDGRAARYFYENSAEEKGDFYQLDKTEDGYEVYLKAPVDREGRKIILDFHEMAVISKLYQLLEADDEVYKLLKEVTTSK